jgi:hypothetical protein
MSNYADNLKIDVNALDKEWIQQPYTYLQYATKAADADDVRKRTKEALEIVQAEIDLEVREVAKDLGEKITEKIVSSRVLLDPKYREAQSNYLTAEHNYAVYQAAVRAMDQKKSALENLVKLTLAGYFSAPTQAKEEGDVDYNTKAKGTAQKELLKEKKEKRQLKKEIK